MIEKNIYKIEDQNGKSLFFDPIDLYGKLVLNSSGKLDQIINDYNVIIDKEAHGINLLSEELIQFELLRKSLIETARKTFNFSKINIETGEGYTDEQVDKILTDFLDFINKKKANTVG